MNARVYADQIIERSRDMMVLQDIDRFKVKAALCEIAISVAEVVAAKAMTVADQQYTLGFKHVGLIMRDLKTLWRAIVRNVKIKYADHPINERILHIVMLASHGSRQREWPKIITSDLSGEHTYFLLASVPSDRKWRINRVLELLHEYKDHVE